MLELIIVLLIIAALVALLLPAVQRARDAARSATCRNNLHQMSLAMQQFRQVRKRFSPVQPGIASGWAIELLPFLDGQSLADEIAGRSLTDPNGIPPAMCNRPTIMTCPNGWEGDSDVRTIPASHYTSLGDLPVGSKFPWVQSPNSNAWEFPDHEGPHAGGYNVVAGLNGEVIWHKGK